MRSGTAVLSAVGRTHHWAGAERLSVKTFRGGGALYDIGTGRHHVDDTGYLIVNEGQAYEVTIDAARQVESFCVFIDPDLARDVHYTVAGDDRQLLDAPHAAHENPPGFIVRVHPHDDVVTPIVECIRCAPATLLADRGWVDEQVRDLVAALLAAHRREIGRASRLDAVRPATRMELYRRLHRARDFVRATLPEPLEIRDLARVACLSPSHFLRAFRRAFGVTPHAFVTAERMKAACRLLASTDEPITAVCLAVAFDSLGSFSWAFRRRHGLPPQAWREAARKKHSARSAAAAL
ncbi:MAG TPA: AraC family transcriptional regulator [Vicinamibacterales bacterium]|jgi:AraC-like DNA-binding protein|nr:AraC family transcriptional regulator [Vicinamibacterales bacterium]